MIDQNEVETKEMVAVVEDTPVLCVDCGKEITGSGWAITRPDLPMDSRDQGYVCGDCCSYRKKGDMILTGKAMLYLYIRHDRYFVSDFLGGLEFKVLKNRDSWHNIAGTRTDVWFNGHDGFVWHGAQFGDWTQICHCKRTKERW